MPFRYVFIFILLGCLTAAHAGQALTLAWDPHPEPNIAGYRLYYGATSGAYSQVVDVGNVTTVSIDNLTIGTRYYFAVTAYRLSAMESARSGEVAFDATPNRPSALIGNLQILADGRTQFVVNQVSGDPAPSGIDVEVSSDLQTWTTLAHLSVPFGAATFVDPEAAGARQRFYRLRQP